MQIFLVDFLQHFAGYRVNVPRLQIAVRRRACRALDQVADNIQIDRLVQEPAAGDARLDRFENIHGLSALFDIPASRWNVMKFHGLAVQNFTTLSLLGFSRQEHPEIGRRVGKRRAA